MELSGHAAVTAYWNYYDYKCEKCGHEMERP